MTNTRRTVLAGMAGGAGAGLLAACGGGGQGSGAPAVAELRGVSLEHWAQNELTHVEGAAKQKVLQQFSAQSGLGISVTSAGGAGPEKVIAAMAAGTPPDMLDGFHFNLSQYYRQGATVDVDAELKSNADWKKARASLYPNIVQGFTWKGKMYGVPLYSSHFNMYFQPELLKRAGLVAPPPKTWTWDQFLDYNRKASRPPEITGYDDQWSYSRTGMMALANGHKFMSADGTKFSYNSPEALEAVEFQQQMIKSGLMRAHDGTASGSYTEKLPDGKVVFQFGVAARVPTYRKAGSQFGTCYFPIGPKNKEKLNYTHGEAYGFSVFKNKDAKKQQAAVLASVWGTRADMGLLLAQEAGTVPSYKSTIEDAAFQANFKKDADAWPFYDVLPGFIPMPNFPGFADVRALGDMMIRDIWAGKGTAREIMNEYTRQGQQKLDDVLK